MVITGTDTPATRARNGPTFGIRNLRKFKGNFAQIMCRKFLIERQK
jgi:hypothetical protein